MTWTPFIIPTCDWIIATACEKCIPKKEKFTPIYKPTIVTYMQYYCGQRRFFCTACKVQQSNAEYSTTNVTRNLKVILHSFIL